MPDRPHTPRMVVYAGRPWLAWLDDQARQARVRPVDLIDQALAHYAQAQGLTAPPPRLDHRQGDTDR